MTLQSLKETIEKLSAEATAGPWHSSDRGIGWEVHLCPKPNDCWDPKTDCCPSLTDDGFRDTMDKGNADFIAFARTALPQLLRIAEELEGKVIELERKEQISDALLKAGAEELKSHADLLKAMWSAKDAINCCEYERANNILIDAIQGNPKRS